MNIYRSLLDLIGQTPLVELTKLEHDLDLNARILAKVEYFNPGGSVKDRAALAMIEDAERSGRLRPGATIIEPTSGNTGIGLAWIAAIRGYKMILVMPDTMSEERRRLLAAYGAELVLTPGAEGMAGAIRRAEELRDATPGAVIMSQFDNPANPAAHEHSTGREIWRDTDGLVDIVVAGVGTGGTITGIARYLKHHNPAIEAVAVEPATSAVLSGGTPGKHAIQGIGAGFVPRNYDASEIDRVMTVTDARATEVTRMLARSEGLLVGISSGAAVAAAIDLAQDPENATKIIVAILPDTGTRYLSTGIF